MNISQLETSIQTLVGKLAEESFLFDLLLAYELPKSSITRLKKGTYNLSKTPGEVLWKKKVFFKKESKSDLHHAIDELSGDSTILKHGPRFIIVTDFQTFLSVDTKTRDTLDIPIVDLAKHYDFFLPWAGLEKSDLRSENPADIKAAERMGRLYDILLEDNPTKTEAERHALNLFLSRLLFCFFAEDTDIFSEDQFTNAVASHTAKDGNDLQSYLQRLFRVLSRKKRSSYPYFLQSFPYVNGGLFSDDSPVPRFNAKSRQIIIECGALDWKAINPDIFGSMIQAVVTTDQRGSLGIHYTSVVNIMRVLEPLFLRDLHDDLKRAGKSKTKLTKLLDRLYHLVIFDPACGCGNFLVIAYKALCKLEIKIFKRLYGAQLSIRTTSNIRTSQFYGIELDDFARETARLSLWLAEHQMNIAFKEVFRRSRPTLPLKDGGNITCGNATRLDWNDICPKCDEHEIYVLGNPPYVGARNQSKDQKADTEHVFGGHKDYKDSDYVCCWFLKATEYIRSRNVEFAFVATNSIAQGEQVGHLWSRVLAHAEIGFAHQSFKWTNSAKNNAGVTCVVVGIRNKSSKPKLLFSEKTCRTVVNISPYLQSGDDTFVRTAKCSLSGLPKMVMGNMPRDGGNLILSEAEVASIKTTFPQSASLFRKLYGANEFLTSNPRTCLWISDEDEELARSIPPVNQRIDKVFAFRSASRAKTTQQYASIPHKFAQRSHKPGDAIIIPCHTSEVREYIPFGFLGDESIISNAAQVLHCAEPYIFAVISSRMHMVWVRAVSGRLETRIRYSSSLCYNTFPFPELSPAQRTSLEEHSFGVLDERERYSERTIKQLYDPERMPRDLRRAHQKLDLAVDKCYRARPFKDDEKRLNHLFRLYEGLLEVAECEDSPDA